MVERRPTNANGPQPRPPRRRSITDTTKDTQRSENAEYGLSRAVDYAHGKAAQAENARTMPSDEAAAILRARSGDDSALFPYTPTPSINPPRPRTQAAGYSAETQTLRIKFRDGPVYEYYDVPQTVWNNFKRVKSPGRAVNRVLNNYAYARRTDLEA